MSKFVMGVIVCGLTIGAYTMCYAQDTPSRSAGQKQSDQKSIIQAMDTNDDGIISNDEFMTARDKCFKAMDKNGDGWISRCEFNAFAEKGFAHVDANKDGSVDSDEATALFMRSGQ